MQDEVKCYPASVANYYGVLLLEVSPKRNFLVLEDRFGESRAEVSPQFAQAWIAEFGPRATEKISPE